MPISKNEPSMYIKLFKIYLCRNLSSERSTILLIVLEGDI